MDKILQHRRNTALRYSPTCEWPAEGQSYLSYFVGHSEKTRRNDQRFSHPSNVSPAHSVIYKIPCCAWRSCDSAYNGQTIRGLETRLGEQKTGFIKRGQNNPFDPTAHLGYQPPSRLEEGWSRTKWNELQRRTAIPRIELTRISTPTYVRQQWDFKLAQMPAMATVTVPMAPSEYLRPSTEAPAYVAIFSLSMTILYRN